MAPKQAVAGPSKPRSALNAPATSAPPRPAVSAFSPSRTMFALAHPALGSADKVSVWDIIEDRFISEWEIEGASKASSITWTSVASASHGKKRRKKEGTEQEEVVVVTTTKGQVFVWSPTRGVLSKFDLAAPATASATSEHGVVLASASSIYLLAADNTKVASTIWLPANTPSPTAIAVLPTSTAETLHLVIASSSALILHITPTAAKPTASTSPLPVSTSTCIALYPIASTQGASFLVVSDDDRTVAQYTIPTPGTEPKLSYRYASPTLAPAHSVSASASHLSVLHSSGEISLFPVPTELDLVRPKSDSKPRTVRLVEGKTDKQSRICRACLSGDALFAGRMTGGGRISWVGLSTETLDGDTKIRCEAQDLLSVVGKEGKLQRYVAPTTTAEAIEGDAAVPSTLPTDVDMADASLGERLLSLPNATGASAPAANGDAELPNKKIALADGPVNAGSLTRLLVQALHTSDPALLSLCLSHRDPALIRNTIRKLPVQLALPLLKACVERLGQGKHTNGRGGTRGVAQNEQQGRGTIEWVKGVLVERGAVLMTMPSLPAHLGALSRLLDQRLELYQPLLTLSGRLDLALAQIAMRRVALEQSGGTAGTGAGKDDGARYVEGESDDEDEDEDVEVEVGAEEGEVEDVDMLNGADSDEEDEDEDDEDEDEEEDDDEDPLESDDDDDGQGLLDLEAEESDDEDDESDDE